MNATTFLYIHRNAIWRSSPSQTYLNSLAASLHDIYATPRNGYGYAAAVGIGTAHQCARYGVDRYAAMSVLYNDVTTVSTNT